MLISSIFDIYGFSYCVLRRIINADINSTNIFTKQSQKKHNNSSKNPYHSHYRTVTSHNFRMYQFAYDYKYTPKYTKNKGNYAK